MPSAMRVPMSTVHVAGFHVVVERHEHRLDAGRPREHMLLLTA